MAAAAAAVPIDYCVAITKKGTQCRNKKFHSSNDNDIFCGLHIKKNPDIVILEGTNKVVPFISLERYLADVIIFNQTNQAIQASIPAAHKVVVASNGDTSKDIKTKNTIARDSNIDINPICTVCSDTFTVRSELVSCSSSGWDHLVCRECLKGHVSSLLSDGIASLECMFNKHEHCHGQYTEEQIKHALDSQKETGSKADAAAELDSGSGGSNINYTKWQEVMSASEIIKLAGICDNYIICPLCCKWGCIFETPIGAEKHPFYIRCAACSQDWCTLCKRGAHSVRSCYELAFSDAELADAAVMAGVVDKMIQDIATRALTHCCGICGCSYVKEEGCNLMTCPKCNGMSCFICGMKLYYKGDTKYWHFTGHDKSDRDAQCPLWNNYAGDGKENQGNTAFNIASIEREFMNFISSNRANLKVAKLISQRIITCYEKDKKFINVLKNIRKML